MRIGIDVRYLSHGLVGGVHAYVINFVPALIKQATDHQIFLYADTKRPFELSDLPEHVTVRYLPYRNELSSIYNDFFMKRVMAEDRLDVVHFPANYGFGPANARTVITLHDEINILPWAEIIRGHRKDPRTVAMMTYLHFCSTRALRRAHLLITVSQYSQSKIIQHSNFNPHRIVAVTNGPASSLRRVEDRAVLANVRERHGLTKPFVLADAVKNPAVLVRAWRLLPPELRKSHQIVFFSRRPDPLPIVHEAEAAGAARLLVRPSNEDLHALYSMSKAFIFPSWLEGLGLPLLEAMICGTPVIASDRGSIPEVAGGAALLSDAEDEATLAQHITRVLSTPAEARRLQQLGFARAAQFAWPKIAQRILECYQKALEVPIKQFA